MLRRSRWTRSAPVALLGSVTLTLSTLAPARTAAMDTASDPHAHHHEMMGSMKRATRSTAAYTVPAVNLVREDGVTVSLPDELDDGRPVLLNFVYTSCTTICPVMTHIFSQVQSRLGGERAHLVSISIDPEQDTPARLAEYARKFHARPDWHFYTGTSAASTAAQRAFAVYRGDKMDHTPVTLLRAAPGRPWTRIDGFASADELIGELHQVLASR